MHHEAQEPSMEVQSQPFSSCIIAVDPNHNPKVFCTTSHVRQ